MLIFYNIPGQPNSLLVSTFFVTKHVFSAANGLRYDWIFSGTLLELCACSGPQWQTVEGTMVQLLRNSERHLTLWMQLWITEITRKKRWNLSAKQCGNIHADWIFETNCRIRSRLWSCLHGWWTWGFSWRLHSSYNPIIINSIWNSNGKSVQRSRRTFLPQPQQLGILIKHLGC